MQVLRILNALLTASDVEMKNSCCGIPASIKFNSNAKCVNLTAPVQNTSTSICIVHNQLEI
jgi:hypothetical protein